MDKKEGEKHRHSSKTKKDETEKILSKKSLLEAILKKIEYYSTKNTVTDLDLYYLVKEFFSTFLELKYEFSFDELILELDKVYLETKQRDEITSFIATIKIIEYKTEPFSEEQTKTYIKDFLPIAKQLSRIQGPPKASIWNKLQLIFAKKEESTFQEYQPTPFGNSTQTEKNETGIQANISQSSANANTGDTLPQSVETSLPSQPISPSGEVDLAAIEEHNRLVLGKPSEASSDESPSVESKGRKKKTSKEKPAKKSKGTRKNSRNEESNKPSASNIPVTENKQESQSIPNDSATPDWSGDNSATIVEAQQKTSTDEKQKTKTGKTTKKTVKENKKAKENIKKNIKIQKSLKSKKSIPAKSSKKIDSKSKQKQIAKKDMPKNQASSPEKEADNLIAQAKKTSNKQQLMSLYKKLNSLYEKSDVKFQTKYYKHLMEIYNKIAKSK